MTQPYERGSPLSRSFLPLALITLGVVFLVGNLIPERDRGGLIVVGLGVAFMVGRLTTGRYGYAVPAGILIAIGSFIMLQSTRELKGLSSGGVFFLLLGLGFAAAYVIGMRPGAVWPVFPAIILAGLGLLLLGAASLGPLASLSWLAAYWPIVLVAVGVWLLLRESLPPAARRPIATLGGLMLLAYGVVAAAASVAAGGAIARTGSVAPGLVSSPFADTLTLQQPISPGQTFTVNNPNGQTTIQGSTGSVVRVVATRHVAFGGQAPDVHLDLSGDGVTLDATPGRARFFAPGSSSIDYSIEIPSGVAVSAQTSSGSISITDVDGQVSATATSGDVRGTRLQHVRTIQTTSGSVELEGVFTEAAQITTTSGSVALTLLPGTAVQLDVHTRGGSVEPRNLILDGGVTRSDTLTGAIGSPASGAILHVQTTSGSISITQ